MAYNPNNWSEKVIALEVETAPGKHMGQVITNYEKSKDRGFFVWFFVFSNRDKEKIVNAFSNKNIDTEDYSVTVMNADIMTSIGVDSDRIRQFNVLQTEIFSTLMNAGGKVSEQYVVDSVWRHDEKKIIEELHKFENKNDLLCEEQTIQNPSNPNDPDDKKTVKMWMFKGYSQSKFPNDNNDGDVIRDAEFSPGTAATGTGTDEMKHTVGPPSNESGDVKPEEFETMPDTVIVSDDKQMADDGHDDGAYADLTEDMLLSVYQNSEDNDDQQNMDKIKNILKKRGFYIRHRNDKSFVSKLAKK